MLFPIPNFDPSLNRKSIYVLQSLYLLQLGGPLIQAELKVSDCLVSLFQHGQLLLAEAEVVVADAAHADGLSLLNETLHALVVVLQCFYLTMDRR